MAQSPSDITGTSPAPFSPFSTYSGSSPLGSELATSDGTLALIFTSSNLGLVLLITDAPDLGAFANVFRELELDQALTVPNGANPTARSSFVLVTPSDDSGTTDNFDPVAWTHHRITSYLSPPTINNSTPDNSASEDVLDSSDTEAETEEIDLVEEVDDARSHSDSALDGPRGHGSSLDVEAKDQPSLGYLDEVLSFLAEEAAQHAARRAAGSKSSSNVSQMPTSPTSDGAWGHAVEPRRKRRRKKARHPFVVAPIVDGHQQRDHEEEAASHGDRETDESSSADPSSSFDISSSSYRTRQTQLQTKSTPATPPRNRKERRRLQQQQLAQAALAAADGNADARPKLTHSRSTPALRLNTTFPLDPRILRLRALAHKLRMFFHEDAKHLSKILSSDSPDEANFVDPRGPKPAGKDSLIHVFVDQ
jgi:hypothetical protein